MSTAVQPWQLTYDDMPDEDFVDGLRLSTECVTRRLIEPLDKDRYHEFPEHLGHRGHGFERVMQEWLIEKHGATSVLREIVVPWEYGETHLDLLVDPVTAAKLWGCTHGGWLLIELKANKEGSVKSENVRQAQRQRFVIERAVAAGKRIRYQHQLSRVQPIDDGFGTPEVVETRRWEWRDVPLEVMANLEYKVVVIDPTTWRIPDPRGTSIRIGDDRRVELEAEWQAMADVMAMGKHVANFMIYDAGSMKARGAVCNCGKCWTPPLEELPHKLADTVAAHLEAKEEEKFAVDVKKYHAGVLYETFQRLRKTPPGEHPKGTWVGSGFKVTITKAGAVLTSRSDAQATPLI